MKDIMAEMEDYDNSVYSNFDHRSDVNCEYGHG